MSRKRGGKARDKGEREGTAAYVSDMTSMPDELLEMMWRKIDWKRAEQRLEDLQRELTEAELRCDTEEERRLQREIVDDLDVRCLAVRHVSAKQTGPGVDREKWCTDAARMRAAFELRSDDFRADPFRRIDFKPKGLGKERQVGLPTMHDRAVARLHGYALAPMTEARADRKSFAFRKGRSAQDAHEYLRKMLTAKDAPRFVVVADVKSFYHWVQHDWIMAHVPMDKDVLRQLLKAGYVYAGKLFPRKDEDDGMSEACGLSPIIANFMLDGLQKHIYRGLNGDVPVTDFADGDMLRFADDIVVTVRDHGTGQRVLNLLRGFMWDRGLILNDEKSGIFSVAAGFTFLGRTYRMEGENLRTFPSKANEERFIKRLEETVTRWKRSQRELIKRLNAMLTGWGNYHRYSDATECFRRVDDALQSMIIRMLMKRHTKTPLRAIVEDYFYEEHGRHYYCLRDDKSVRVMKLGDAVLARHVQVRCTMNAYEDTDYLEERTNQRAINNVTGPYKAIWRRQRHRCHHCGEEILVDQPKAVVPIDITKRQSVENTAYVHAWCATDEYQVIYTEEPLTSYITYDTEEVLREALEMDSDRMTHAHLPREWAYWPLKEHLACSDAASVTLTFAEIEGILGHDLPKAARRHKPFWYENDGSRRGIWRAWNSEGYEMGKLDLKGERVTFRRLKPDYVHVYLPRELTEQRILDDTAYELNQFAKSIVKKYALDIRK